MASLLYGMAVHQSYRYYHLYPLDRPWVKAMVALTMCLETAHTALIMHQSYVYVVTDFFNPTVRLIDIVSAKLLPVLTGVIVLVTQLFFAWRLYIAGSGFRIASVVAVVLLVTELVFFITSTAFIFQDHTFDIFRARGHTWLVTTGTALVMSVDVLMTSILVYAVYTSRTTSHRNEGKCIDNVIAYGANTGLLSSAVAILSFVLIYFYDDYLLPSAVFMVSTKLYANTLLAALNSRPSTLARGVVGVSEHKLFGSSMPQSTAVDTSRGGASWGTKSTSTMRFKPSLAPSENSTTGTRPSELHFTGRDRKSVV